MGRALKDVRKHHSFRKRAKESDRYWNKCLRANNYRSAWKTSSAQCLGRSHERKGVPCQDYALHAAFEDVSSVIALSDGAGSARYSQYGAQLATRRAASLIASHFDEAFGSISRTNDLKRKLISQLQYDLRELSELGIDFPSDIRLKYGLPERYDVLLVPCALRDLSCTLLVVAVKGNRYLAFHVGDGVVGAETRIAGRQYMSVLSSPDNGEFANETYFITSSAAVDKARLMTGSLSRLNGEIAGFILMSDGSEAALYDKRNRALGKACGKLLDANRALGHDEMESKLHTTLAKTIRQKTTDDCSIALMSRDPSLRDARHSVQRLWKVRGATA